MGLVDQMLTMIDVVRSKAHVSEFNYRHCKSCDRVFECHRTLVDHRK
jgi:hypothetical protein